MCQLLSMSIPIIHSEIREMITRLVSGPSGPTVRQTWEETSFIIWCQYAPTLTGGPWWCFGPLGIPIDLDPESNISQKFRVFLFPQSKVIQGMSINHFRGGLKKWEYTCCAVLGPSSWTPSLSQSMCSRSENRLSSWNQTRDHDLSLQWDWPQPSTHAFLIFSD